VLVHPANPQVVFACALGRATGPQQERGVFRTTNGGETWDRVLFVNADTGCSGISMDAKDPNVLIAGMWQVVMHTHACSAEARVAACTSAAIAGRRGPG
jgi:hypothetical protein